MGRITSLQNEIGHLQATLHDRNEEIRRQAEVIRKQEADIAALQKKLSEAADALAKAA